MEFVRKRELKYERVPQLEADHNDVHVHESAEKNVCLVFMILAAIAGTLYFTFYDFNTPPKNLRRKKKYSLNDSYFSGSTDDHSVLFLPSDTIRYSDEIVSFSPSTQPPLTDITEPLSANILDPKPLDVILSMTPEQMMYNLTYRDLHIDDPEANFQIRLKYYTLFDSNVPSLDGFSFYNPVWNFTFEKFCTCGTYKDARKNICKKLGVDKKWMYDMCPHLQYFGTDSWVIMLVGDETPEDVGFANKPILTKVRHFHEKVPLLLLNSHVLYNINNPTESDISWEEKKSLPIWVGANTGFKWPYPRGTFVEKYFSKYNETIHLYKLFNRDTDKVEWKSYKQYVLPPIQLPEQLQYKYLVSLEGNDVATNFGWVLNSNSVPIAIPPTIEAWFCYRFLEPYVHYLPLDADLNNLEELMYWCEENNEDCRQIAENGKAFMSQFTDFQRELNIAREVIRAWFKSQNLHWGQR